MTEIADVKRWVKLHQWSEMLSARLASGQTVKAWCKENGICIKTYYYRLKSIRMAALQEPEKAAMYLAKPSVSSTVFAKLDFNASAGTNKIADIEKNDICAAIVRIGDVEAFINNGADPVVIANTLKSIRDIC